MGDVTALMMDVITEKSGHAVVPMAVSVCLTPAAPAPLPIPYPVVASSIEGIGDAPMRTKINGALIATVGSVLKTCHGNEPGTLKEVVSLNTTGPVFLVLGAPIVLCELGMMGITGSLCISNKAPTPGVGGSASSAGGSGGPGGGGGEGSASGGNASGPGGPGGGGGAGGGGSNTGASGPGSSSGAPSQHQCQDGHPVDVVTGYVVDEATDITLPGVIPLVWKRLYSSSRRSDSGASLGPGWAHGFEQRIVEEERTITLREAEGRSVWFARVKPGEATFHRRERLTLTRDADGRTYRVYSHATRLTQVFTAEADQGPALLRSIRDAWDNAITLEHDGPRLTRIVDTAGREVRVTWKEERITRLEVRASGRLEQWVDYTYSASRCLTGVIDALGGAEEFEYDRFHRMTAAVIKTGVRFQYEYEANTGRCKKTWGPKGLYAIELRTDKAAKTTHIDGEEPRIITWNEQGLATRIALDDGTVLGENAYDDGFLIARVNGAGEGEQYWYDERGNQVHVLDAMGNAVTVDHDDRDLPVRRTTADGQITTYTHDDRGALRGVVHPSGEARSFSYDSRGRLTGIHDQRGLLRGFEYDAQHNVIAETDASGTRTTYGNDAMGRPVSRTDALGRVTRASYDRLGFRTSTRFPDGTTLQQSRDARGRVVREVDPMGRVTTAERGGMGVITRLTQPDGGSWTFEYTSTEKIREIKNPRGEAYSFTRDDAGRVTRETTFDGRALALRWSEAGRLARIDYPDGSSRGFLHDRLGNVLREEASDRSVITYRRDRTGQLLGARLEEDGRQIETQLERDALGQVIVARQGDRAIRYAYDQYGQRIGRTMPNGATTRYGYDAAGALVLVTHDGTELRIEHDALGRRVRQSYGNGGVALSSAYDELDRLVEQRVTRQGDGVPDVLVQRQWRYDRAGQVTRIDDARWGATTYRYDAAYRLLEAVRGAHQEAFTYDAAGSLVRAAEGLLPASSEPWRVAPGNLLGGSRDATYAYDMRGRRVGKLSLREGESAVHYSWDVRDRLREVKLPDGTVVHMTYDAFGRRIRKDVRRADGGLARSVEFLWDGEALAADLDSDRRGPRCFVQGPGTLVPLLQQEHGEVFACITDHLGTPKEPARPTSIEITQRRRIERADQPGKSSHGDCPDRLESPAGRRFRVA